MTTPPDAVPQVDLFVDPVCPFAWITSRWLAEVERLCPIRLSFQVMSLSVLNDGRADISDFYRDLVERAWGTARVLVATQDGHGPEATRRLYEALGTRLHLQDRRADQALIVDALGAAGLPPDLADVADTDAWDDRLRASHHRGMDPVGDEVGTPVVHIRPTPDAPTVALFGPVLSSCPRGHDALRLWDAVLAAASTPQFFELKRSRNVPLSFEEETR